MINNPFTEEDYKAIVQALEEASDLRPLIDKARNCGTDCEEENERLNKAVETLESVKREFFKRGKPVPIERK